MSVDLLEKPATNTAPPKRWRNWWRAKSLVNDHCAVCGLPQLRDPGDVWPGHCRVYPSKDAAETVAAQIVAENLGGVIAQGFDPDLALDYLGAFPDGERP